MGCELEKHVLPKLKETALREMQPVVRVQNNDGNGNEVGSWEPNRTKRRLAQEPPSPL
jgi:hypothetical protein